MNQFHFIDMQCTADSTSEIIPFNTGRKDNSHIIFTSFQFIFIYSFSSLCHKWQIKLRPLIRFLPVFLINASYGYQIRMIKTVRCIQCFCLFICLVKDCINIPRILFIFYNISILIGYFRLRVAVLIGRIRILWNLRCVCCVVYGRIF